MLCRARDYDVILWKHTQNIFQAMLGVFLAIKLMGKMSCLVRLLPWGFLPQCVHLGKATDGMLAVTAWHLLLDGTDFG